MLASGRGAVSGVLLRQKQTTMAGWDEHDCFVVTEVEGRKWGSILSPNGEVKWQ